MEEEEEKKKKRHVIRTGIYHIHTCNATGGQHGTASGAREQQQQQQTPYRVKLGSVCKIKVQNPKPRPTISPAFLPFSRDTQIDDCVKQQLPFPLTHMHNTQPGHSCTPCHGKPVCSSQVLRADWSRISSLYLVQFSRSILPSGMKPDRVCVQPQGVTG
jgi:hypothetical protein